MRLHTPLSADEAARAEQGEERAIRPPFSWLALAAYNAGPAPVAACGCVPPYPETQGYVARIIGLLGGAGEPVGSGG